MASDNLEQLYQAVIGPRSQDYYLSQFSRLDEKWQSAYSWNWPAFFVGFPWLLYRKMWLHALLYFILPGIFLGATILIVTLIGKFVGAIALISLMLYLAAILVWVPGNANRIYYRHCRRKLAKAEKKSPHLHEQIERLAKRGGTSIALAVLISSLALVLLSATAFAGYRFGQAGSQVARVYWFGSNVSAWIGDYYADHQIMPDNLAQAGFDVKLPPSIKAIDMDSSGAITVTLAIPTLEGKTLRWVPSNAETLTLSWTCSSPDIPNWYLPPACQTRGNRKRP